MLEFFKNFMVWFDESRSEFKKISWPTREDIKGSTMVVCVTIAFFMLVLGVYDTALLWVMKLIGFTK